MPVPIPGRKGEVKLFDQDECPVETSYESLVKMRPAFKKDGVGTAGNASIISDGAAAVVVMSREKAEELGCTIMAEIGAQASAGIDLRYVLMAPILAIPKVLKKEGIGIEDIEIFEVNEAFSGTSVAINRVLGLDPAKVNVNGGSVALGHPIGASGARLLTTLLYQMEKQEAKRGLVSLCLGGGEAVALVRETITMAHVLISNEKIRQGEDMEIKKFGVIGAGQMGGGIAQVAAASGLQVLMSDIKEEFVEKGLAADRQKPRPQRRKGQDRGGRDERQSSADRDHHRSSATWPRWISWLRPRSSGRI